MALLTASAVPAAVGLTSGDCVQSDIFSGSCPIVSGEIVNDGVQLGGNVTIPGSGGSGSSGAPSGGGGASSGSAGGATNSEPQAGADASSGEWVRPPIVRDDYTVTGPVRLSDLVNFRPIAGSFGMEPDGWIITGLHTNFFANSAVHVQNGVLLDLPASVRFTPVRYRWSYGDGATKSTQTAGNTWKALGLTEFDPTATSHVYTRAGSYTIELTVDFAAEYRFDDGAWVPVAGTLPLRTSTTTATAGSAKTVLVNRECGRIRSGPGC